MSAIERTSPTMEASTRPLTTPMAAPQARQLEMTAKFFRGLTDVTRLRIVELLLEHGEMNVTELVAALNQQQGRVSSHLACLRWCGYVSSRRDGKYMYYRVADERIARLLRLARGIIDEHGAAILTCSRM